ncbi:MAG: ferrous iron transport protein B [Bacteroidales bacterium]|nr:ferrous iron transport protein B [Bacteroidales bacterium]
MTLADLKEGSTATITKVRGHGAFRKRIAEMGFVKGKTVKVIKNAPLRDPVQYSILGYELSLRRSEARLIEVAPEGDSGDETADSRDFNGIFGSDNHLKEKTNRSRVIDVALVGNPNSGKTTLFNITTKSHGHVGNYTGVTVDSKQAKLKLNGYTINIIDLPGTYSLSAYSPEELYVRKYIFGHHPDMVINVIDASNLERNLFLTTQLIDMDIQVIVALNMYDELEQKGDKFDYMTLGSMVGIPFVPTIASKGKGIQELFSKVIEVFEEKEQNLRRIHINYGKNVETSIAYLQGLISENKGLSDRVSARFYAIKLLEKDTGVHFTLSRMENYREIREAAERETEKLQNLFKDDSEMLITDARYGFIAGALKETYTANKFKRKLKTDTEIIDTFLTHKIFGFPIFLFFLWFTFQATFRVGQYPMDWIESGIHHLGKWVGYLLPDSIFRDLIVNGVIDGVGGVVVFIPNILILFLFISFMEDTGYMSRAAFIMDKIMHKIGLHGKSFIPLIMGFGCNVPAIMATRTIENRNDRLLTILINPFMSCSARLPVYILIAGSFFRGSEVTVIFLVYLIGIAFAVLMALLFKKTIFRSEEAPFVMELPPYRLPTARVTIGHMWFKTSQYVRKIGGVILLASIIIWALGYFPMSAEPPEDTAGVSTLTPDVNDIPGEPLFGEGATKTPANADDAHFENSYIARTGRFFEPVMQPLGFDWKMTVSLLSGIAAKEVVVSTLGVLYQTDPEKGSETLKTRLQEARHTSGPRKGESVFTPVVAFAYLMFILLYFPCIGVVSTVKKEAGGWKWALFLVTYTTGLAWLMAFVVNQAGRLML